MSKKMKKLILLIISILILSDVAHAYVSTEKGYILFTLGLSSFEVNTVSAGEGITYAISIKGNDLSGFNAKNSHIFSHDKQEIKLKPKIDSMGIGGYEFWNIIGNHKGGAFLISGITLEGELIENKLLPHTFYALILLIILIFALITLQRKLKK